MSLLFISISRKCLDNSKSEIMKEIVNALTKLQERSQGKDRERESKGKNINKELIQNNLGFEKHGLFPSQKSNLVHIHTGVDLKGELSFQRLKETKTGQHSIDPESPPDTEDENSRPGAYGSNKRNPKSLQNGCLCAIKHGLTCLSPL